MKRNKSGIIPRDKPRTGAQSTLSTASCGAKHQICRRKFAPAFGQICSSNNKGIALVYTVLTMLLVFAICMLITTLMLAQITYYTSYSEKSAQKYLYSQIGDIFLQSDGNFYSGENGFAKDDESVKTTPFYKELSKKYDMDSLHVVVNYFENGNDINLTWEGIKYDKTILTFKLDKINDDITVIVYNRTNSQRAMLKVTLRLSETGSTQIIEWNRGGE